MQRSKGTIIISVILISLFIPTTKARALASSSPQYPPRPRPISDLSQTVFFNTDSINLASPNNPDYGKVKLDAKVLPRDVHALSGDKTFGTGIYSGKGIVGVFAGQKVVPDLELEGGEDRTLYAPTLTCPDNCSLESTTAYWRYSPMSSTGRSWRVYDFGLSTWGMTIDFSDFTRDFVRTYPEGGLYFTEVTQLSGSWNVLLYNFTADQWQRMYISPHFTSGTYAWDVWESYTWNTNWPNPFYNITSTNLQVCIGSSWYYVTNSSDYGWFWNNVPGCPYPRDFTSPACQLYTWYIGSLATTPALHLESSQDTSATSNLGTITFDGVSYNLPADLSYASGTYQATYYPALNRVFDHWEVTGGITVSSTTVNPTSVTVSSPGGTLRAIYTTVPSLVAIISINADGSISPLTAPISTTDNITYTLTGNTVNDSIVIQRNNIVVDGGGHTVQGILGYVGIDLTGRNNVTVKNTQIENFTYGIWLDSSSSGNTLSGNNFANNNYGIFISSSSSAFANFIFHNSFVANPVQAYTDGSANIWDNGYPSGGNYWSIYGGTDLFSGPHQNVTGSDGIGDTPYVIDASNKDNYPLTRPYVPFDNQTIYIRADGNVDPSGAPILRQGDLYTLTGNVTSDADGVVIERNNMTLDGAGHSLQGPGIGEGIGLDERTNVTVQNIQIMAFDYGIGLYFSSKNTISNDSITGNDFGIDLSFSADNIISGDNVANNTYGIRLTFSGSNSIFGSNVAGNKEDGIWLYYSQNNFVSGNNATANLNIGIWLDYSSDFNTVSENDVMANNWAGIVLSSSSSDNSVSGNTIAANNYYGVFLQSSGYNSISGNNITDNHYGVWLEGNSSGNVIYHNDFVENTRQVYFIELVNVWDDSYPSGGNYWSDYSGTDLNSGVFQNETGSDGIGDTPYPAGTDNQDNYPLMNPWSPPDIAVTNLTSAKTVIGQGYTGSLNVTFENLGNKIEAFNATVYANSTCILSEQTLLAMTNCTLNFGWNTTGFAYGNYTISAYAWPVPDETNTADNNFTGGWVMVAGVGDLTGGTPNAYDFVPDGKVLIEDISVVAKFFGQKVPPAPANVDLTGPTLTVPDGKIQIDDVATVAKHFGEHYP